MGIYGDLLKLNDQKAAPAPQTRKPAPGSLVEPTTDALQTKTTSEGTRRDTMPPRHHATTPPRHRGITVARYHDVMIQAVRAAVKLFGKEAATHRFTSDEKKAIADIVYTYKQRNLKTSENEITRIGVNFILRDYAENGEESVLDRVLKALNS